MSKDISFSLCLQMYSRLLYVFSLLLFTFMFLDYVLLLRMRFNCSV